MKRRRLLAGAVSGLAVSAGCLDRSDADPTGGEPGSNGTPGDENGDESRNDDEAIAGDLVEYDLSTEEAPYDDDLPYPDVTFGSETVTITGTIVVGSPGCKAAEVTEIAYDADEAVLSVEIEDVDTDDGDEERICTTEVVAETYELIATFDEGVPETVRVVESGVGGSRELIADRDGSREKGTENLDERPDGIVDADLAVSAGDLDEAEDAPDVTFEDDTVVIEGTVMIGSSSCKTVDVTALEYDGDSLDVTIEDVGVDLDDEPQECTDDESAAAYVLTISVEEDVPGNVSVTERGRDGSRSVGVGHSSERVTEGDDGGDGGGERDDDGNDSGSEPNGDGDEAGDDGNPD